MYMRLTPHKNLIDWPLTCFDFGIDYGYADIFTQIINLL